MVKSLLIVEDNPDNRMLIHMIVKRFIPGEIELFDAHNGEEGLRLAFENQPTLILMDLKLPKMDGIEAIEKLKSDPATHDIPIIVLSAQVLDDDIARAQAAGAGGYLTKPIDITSFVKTVKPFFTS